MKKKRTFSRFFIPAFLILVFCLAGCGKTGKLNEGACKCTIVFTDVPKELSMLEENLQDNFRIRLELRNIANDKEYKITLNAANDFKKEISLNPGTYQIMGPYIDQASNIALKLSADKEDITLAPEVPSTISIRVDNQKEFTEHWMAIQPIPEVLLAEKFSEKIQFNRQLINIKDILPYLNLSYDKQVKAYGKASVMDTDLGITVLLQNTGSTATDWKNCKLYGIQVTKNNVVFPKGVTLGMTAKKVCHNKDGLYGEPDRLSGTLLFGWSFGKTDAIYTDPASGDKIIINLGSDGNFIHSITYQFGQF